MSGHVFLYFLSLLPQMKHFLSSMIYLNLEIYKYNRAFRFTSVTVAKVPHFPPSKI